MNGPGLGNGEIAFELSPVLAAATPDKGKRSRFHYLVATGRPDGFKADGSLKEWAALRPVELGIRPDQRELPGWRGRDDCYARWYCAWDDRAFYFAAEVQDDLHQPARPHPGAGTIYRMWEADSIQIAIDVAGDAQPSSNVPAYDGLNDVEFGLAIATNRQSLLHFWVNPKGNTGRLLSKELAVVRDEAARKTRYEVAIPWSHLGLKRSPAGKWMGMNVLINDNDGKGRRGWLEWSPGIGYTKDASHFPKVLFSRD